MEPTSIVIGAIGLTSVFSTCVECFDYIQLGRSFGGDYGKCVLRLDAAKVRLSRWGESLGIAAHSQGVTGVVISSRDFGIAQNLLQQIIDTFEDTEKISQRYERYTKMQGHMGDNLAVFTEQTDLNERDSRLHTHLRAIARQRQDSTSLLNKARWALYEKRKFDQLIAEITEFVDKLVALFPTIEATQVQLCQREISQITDAEELASLQIVAAADDGILQGSIEAEQARRGHIATNWKASEQSEVWIGDENDYGVESRGHHTSEFDVSGSAIVRIGNKNKGKLSADR